MRSLEKIAFATPGWLFLLLAIPVLCFLGFNQGARSWILYPTLRVLGTFGWKPKDTPFRLAPLVLPLALIPAILGLARPQLQQDRSSRTASGIDILIALDVSRSMEIADFQDAETRALRRERRIDAAKKVITAFIKGRPDDRIGIVTFAARPYTVAPLTLSHEIIAHALEPISLVDGEESGTAIGSAISAAATRLENLQNSKSKVVVLVTDGMSNSGQLSPLEAAELAGDLGIKVYPVAIGTESGRLKNGVPQKEFDEETLKKIAEITKGDYYRAQNYTGLREAFSSIDKLEKTEVQRERWIQSEDLYPWFILPSMIIIFLFLAFSALNPPTMP